MFARSIKRLSKRPGTTIGTVLIVIVATAGIALLFAKDEPNRDTDVTVEPRAARIERVEGSVLISDFAENQQPDWTEATINTPVAVGDRIYARDGSSASIALTGRNQVELKPGGSLDVLSLTDHETQLALRSGSALFNIGELEKDEMFEVATPSGAVDFVEPGLYQVGIDGDNAVVSVLRGLAQVVGEGGTEYINQGQAFTLLGANGTQALASTLEPQLAGGIVDDYYRDRYPETYDGRYASYDAYLEDPSYYDSYQGSQSYEYLPVDIAGVRDLDYYGDWTDIDGYGQCWAPRVSADWAPFRHGYWQADSFWGPTWVSYEPWGWAPYHYGRWAFVNQRWFWVPAEVVRQPVYCPAPVAFISLTDANHIGWVPLAPGEVFVPRYYDAHFQPQYLVSQSVVREVAIQQTFVNLHAPSGVTVVPVQALRRAIDPRVITHIDSSVIANHRATLDPFAIEGFRQLALRKKDARQQIKLARIERRALNRQVVTSRTPAFLSQRADIAKGLRAERVSEARSKNKLKVDRTGQVVNARRRDGLPQFSVDANQRQQQKTALAARANQGDKSARRELRKMLRQEQRADSNRPRGKQPVTSPPAIQRQAERQQLRQQVKKQLRLQQRQKSPTADRLRDARQAQRQQKAARRPQQQQARPQQKQQQRVNRQQQPSSVQRQQRPQKARPQPRRPRRKPSGIASQQTQRSESLRQRQIRQNADQAGIQRSRQKAARQAHLTQQRQQSRARQQQAIKDRQNKTSATQATRQAQTGKRTRVQRQVEQKRQQTVNKQGKVRPRKNQ